MGDAIVLGLSTGATCVSTCVPLVLPFLFSEDSNGRKNAGLVGLFMAGRLAGYLAVGFLLGALGAFTTSFLDPHLSIRLKQLSYPVAGILMLLTGLVHNFPGLKLCKLINRPGRSALSSALLGLLTGFSLCPPFFAAAARVFGQQTSWGGMLYFALFFVGTSVWFLPLFGAHFLKRWIGPLRLVSRMVLLLVGGYYLIFMGLLGSF